MKSRASVISIILIIVIAILFPVGLLFGSVDIHIDDILALIGGQGDAMTHFVVIETRLPALLAALVAGASLAVAGLLMQTCFANPLAGPSIMGISSGASLGVAVVMMAGLTVVGLLGNVAVVAGAIAGAMAVLVILLILSSLLSSAEMLLIAGILIGYFTSSVIALLNYFAPEYAVHGYVMWGMGNFNGVDIATLPLFTILCAAAIAVSLFYIRSLNILLFGVNYAQSIGMRVMRVRSVLISVSGVLTAIVTAWCGPIGFIGLVIPHIARMAAHTSNHRQVLPLTILFGALVGLVCQILSVAPSAFVSGNIPINAITPVIGVPVIGYVLLNRRKLLYFN